MVAFILLSSLALMIGLPILSAKGRGWRGLWFGLAIGAFVASLFFIGMAVSTTPLTVEQIGHVPEDKMAVTVVGGTNMFFDVGLPLLGGGAFVGCLIAGCVYRKRASPEARKAGKEPTIQLED